MWCDLEESVGSRTCDIFSFLFIEFLVRRATFWWQPHLNRTSGSNVIAIERFSKKKNKHTHTQNAFLFLYSCISQSMLPTSDWSRQIATHVIKKIWYRMLASRKGPLKDIITFLWFLHTLNFLCKRRWCSVMHDGILCSRFPAHVTCYNR